MRGYLSRDIASATLLFCECCTRLHPPTPLSVLETFTGGTQEGTCVGLTSHTLIYIAGLVFDDTMHARKELGAWRTNLWHL